MTNRSSAHKSPIYRQVANDILRAIVEGRYPVGELLPTEMELCKKFEVSRHTVREALRKLQDQGLIERRRGAGTIVRSAESRPNYAMGVGSLTDMMQFLGETKIDVVQTVTFTVDEVVAARIGVPIGERWIRVDTFRTMANIDRPLSWTEFYLPQEYQDIVEEIDKRVGPVYELIESRFGTRIEEIEQEMAGCLVEEKMAHHLGIEVGEPALRVKHRLIGAEKKLLEVAISTYPADRFRYSVRMRLERH